MNFTSCSDKASETRQVRGTGENHGEETFEEKLRTTVGQCRILIWLLPRMPTSPDYEIDWRELKRFRLKAIQAKSLDTIRDSTAAFCLN